MPSLAAQGGPRPARCVPRRPRADWSPADTAYGTGKLLAWLLGKSITPHIPVRERYPSSDGMFSRSDFTYDAERDICVCPNSKLLRTSGTSMMTAPETTCHNLKDCRAYTLKQRCTRAPFKKIARDINEDARNHARTLKGTPAFERSSNERKKVEMRFAFAFMSRSESKIRHPVWFRQAGAARHRRRCPPPCARPASSSRRRASPAACG